MEAAFNMFQFTWQQTRGSSWPSSCFCTITPLPLSGSPWIPASRADIIMDNIWYEVQYHGVSTHNQSQIVALQGNHTLPSCTQFKEMNGCHWPMTGSSVSITSASWHQRRWWNFLWRKRGPLSWNALRLGVYASDQARLAGSRPLGFKRSVVLIHLMLYDHIWWSYMIIIWWDLPNLFLYNFVICGLTVDKLGNSSDYLTRWMLLWKNTCFLVEVQTRLRDVWWYHPVVWGQRSWGMQWTWVRNTEPEIGLVTTWVGYPNTKCKWTRLIGYEKI